MLTKRELKEIFEKTGFRPLKKFGENYLIDGNIKEKIITTAAVTKDDVVLEIGPGFGALTMDLAETGAAVYAVEKDRKAFAIFKDIIGPRFPNLTLLNQDILGFDLKGMAAGGKVKVVGNLPYYITTPIIEYLIRNRGFIRYAVITVQKEVADRLLAGPGSKDYGSISCFVQCYMEVEYLHTVKAVSFHPVPTVDSSLIKLKVRDKPCVAISEEEGFFKVVRLAFNQRRKAILNSLSRIASGISKSKLAEHIREAGIDPLARPEDLTLVDFARLARNIRKA